MTVPDNPDQLDVKFIPHGKKAGGMMIMPATPGTCAMCAVDHPPELPHNLQSLFYGMRFKMKWGRDPTWADAAAHCTPHTIRAWRLAMEQRGIAWTEPTEGEEPIREPYAVSDPAGADPFNKLTKEKPQ